MVKTHCAGKAYLCRYCDDFVCAFSSKVDADKFYRVLAKRLDKFGLELAAEKTQVISFNRWQKADDKIFEFGIRVSLGYLPQRKTHNYQENIEEKAKKVTNEL